MTHWEKTMGEVFENQLKVVIEAPDESRAWRAGRHAMERLFEIDPGRRKRETGFLFQPNESKLEQEAELSAYSIRAKVTVEGKQITVVFEAQNPDHLLLSFSLFKVVYEVIVGQMGPDRAW